MTFLTTLQAPTTPPPISRRQSTTEVQLRGLRVADPEVGASAGRGGAGLIDHNAVEVGGCTVMVPVHTGGASDSSFLGTAPDETAAGEWFGSRLAAHRDFRGLAWIGADCIRHAVRMARARGCSRFLAHEQSQNAPLFHRRAWRTLPKIDLDGRPYHWMAADLSAYPHRSRTDIAVFPFARRAA